MLATANSVLPDDILQRCLERAPGYDHENRFFQEDFDELRGAGYLTMAVPKELGGRGMSLAEVCRETRRLAYHAPPTALALNMHNYWVGLVADLWRGGDKSLEWLLEAAADGEVFAAGHAEKGNDIPLLYSTTMAERVDGGYRFTGHKSFGSLTPVWTYLGIHGLDTSDPNAPKVVHAFMPRSSAGYRVEPTWDHVLGMRATRSDDTILEGVFIPDQYIARVVPSGFAGIDGFVLGAFAWALLGFGNVYLGLARRAFDLTTTSLQKKTSVSLSRGELKHHPGLQHDVAEMALELERIEPHLESVARDYSEGVDHGHAWGPKIVAAKCAAVEGAWRVVDMSLDVLGGFGIFPASGIERLIRDARLGRLHPANSYLTREILAKASLGIDLDERPRWG
ncbi:MAG: acyl-CoA/acyl-ACP dehydrogenase [Candidatus Latescibacterota bacterium]|nr:MAG: acyl-CoA/acyl-ACP dehydrogenase [Candidatus Latescibacterota bacterium]